MTRRDEVLKWLKDHKYPESTELTCDDCDGVTVCKFAFDPYCVDGKCMVDR